MGKQELLQKVKKKEEYQEEDQGRIEVIIKGQGHLAQRRMEYKTSRYISGVQGDKIREKK